MVLLAHPGTQYSHQLAKQLVRHDSLYEFWTGFALARDSRLVKLLNNYFPASWRKKIANRIIQGVPAKRLRTMPLVELQALKQIRGGKSPQHALHNRNQVFQERIPTASLRQATALIGFDTSSWILAKRAAELRKPYFLDQSTPHPLTKEALLQKVAQEFPAWKDSIESRSAEIHACEQREYELATRIVVASSFSKNTLVAQGVDADKISINPYGVDLTLFHPPATPRLRQPLRFLFIGMISAHKGVPLLVEAWRRMNLTDAELWLVGPATERERSLIPELPGLKFLGKRPHRELPELLRQCDVVVFPSHCDGFGQVLLEALASGMPVITTETTAGPDLIEDGVEGRLIPSGDLDALCAAMQTLAREPDGLERMGRAARRAAEKFSWDAYGDRWQQIIRDFA